MSAGVTRCPTCKQDMQAAPREGLVDCPQCGQGVGDGNWRQRAEARIARLAGALRAVLRDVDEVADYAIKYETQRLVDDALDDVGDPLSVEERAIVKQLATKYQHAAADRPLRRLLSILDKYLSAPRVGSDTPPKAAIP
jgi:hypothetical protein